MVLTINRVAVRNSNALLAARMRSSSGLRDRVRMLWMMKWRQVPSDQEDDYIDLRDYDGFIIIIAQPCFFHCSLQLDPVTVEFDPMCDT
jgi:hypothetical protein